ncbi:pitrilysin family protein [Afifella sp. IM 167]|uniref:M16 family metallopeptidase n=1 Tax=Afifella sp. IM 167 TaxID=2033586 RepID=UPI001CCA5752|nr:pitrilysin family protein [Afifella sp. IM 167]MBZ8133485.1 peptidase M16 [Afifella sp. IM 167]
MRNLLSRPAAPLALLIGATMSLALAMPSPAKAIDIQEVTSPGGITAWLVEDYTVPIVTVQFAFRGGSAQDPDGKEGTGNLLSGLLDEGAGDLDSKTFQTRLENRNIKLSFDIGRDAFYGSLKTLADNREEAFDLTRMALSEPRFDDEPVSRIKAQIISKLRSEETDPEDLARKAWSHELFGEHPYGHDSEGTPETVEKLTAEDLRGFAAKNLARDNLVVAVVGAIDAETLKGDLDKLFSGLPEKPELRPIPDVVATNGKSEHIDLPVPQTVIRIGGAGLKRDDPDFIPAYVADHILGGGTFSSRLYREIREKRGLAYSVGSSLVPLDHSGAWVAAAATRSDAAKEAVDLMLAEVKGLAEKGPTTKELDEAKSYLTGNYALRFDSSAKIAKQLLGIQLDRLGIDYVDKRNDLIRSVSEDDVKRAATRVYGAPASVVTVGSSSS